MNTINIRAGAILGLVLGAVAGAEEPMLRVAFNIAPQAIGPALTDLGEQAGLQVLVRGEDVRSLQPLARPVTGELTVQAALDKVLANTGLTYTFLNDRTVRVAKEEAPKANAAEDSPQNPKAPAPGAAEKSDKQDDSGNTALGEPVSMLQEIVVTAQKKEERLMDVPVPVATISGAALVSSNQLRLQDYFNRIPALSVTPGPQAANYVVIRGVTTGVGNPTVGILVDDAPYGSVAELGGGLAAPDIDPNDLARVEVLRGPQGTLYGASSLGGLLKFVTVDPSTDGFSGRISAGTTSVKNGDDLGYNFRGAINVPLSDSLAVRASGFSRHEPGYIDNPVLGIDGVNEAKGTGGRLSALWKPSDTFSLKLSALRQKLEGDGFNQVRLQPGLGTLEQDNVIGAGTYSREAEAYSANMAFKIGNAEVTSVSGYSANAFTEMQDFHRLFAAPVLAPNDNEMNRFTQEIRLAAPLGESLDLLLGGFYTDEDARWLIDFNTVDPVTGAPTAQLFGFAIRTGYREVAGFANLTAHLTDRFSLQVGGRQGSIDQELEQTSTFAPVAATETAESDPFTYLVTPQFKISPNLMTYARFASGYRVGGVNNNSVVGGFPSQYKPDKTQNYEIGVKGDFLDGTLFLDASAYYIDWKDVQVLINLPLSVFTYRANVASAKSQGVELSIDSRPAAGWRVTGWLAWNDAVLTEDFPPGPTVGVSGDRLPYTSRFSGNLSLDKHFNLSPNLSASVGASVSYVGDRMAGFISPPLTRRKYPGYAKIDVVAGVTRDSWTVNMFVNNLADKRGIYLGIEDRLSPGQFDLEYIQPRTVGFSIVKNFGL